MFDPTFDARLCTGILRECLEAKQPLKVFR